jgi:hypothetical protein
MEARRYSLEEAVHVYVSDLLLVEAAGEGRGRGIHHVVGNARCLSQYGAEPQSGEDVAVVLLVEFYREASSGKTGTYTLFP